MPRPVTPAGTYTSALTVKTFLNGSMTIGTPVNQQVSITYTPTTGSVSNTPSVAWPPGANATWDIQFSITYSDPDNSGNDGTYTLEGNWKSDQGAHGGFKGNCPNADPTGDDDDWTADANG